MTSTFRNGYGWDHNIQRYKNYDPFCEPGLISVLFLSCGKPKLTAVSLQSTLEATKNYVGEIEWIFLEQGECEENYRLFSSFPANRKVVVRQKNFGINNGLNQLWALSRGEFCFIHESDWFNKQPDLNIFGIAKKIFEQDDEISVIQCRAIWDDAENWGFGKPEFNPWSCRDLAAKEGFPVSDEELESGYRYYTCRFRYGFNNNPNFIRKKLYRECGVYPEADPGTDPRHGETEYQERVALKKYKIAQIGQEVYYHIGGSKRPIFENIYDKTNRA